MSCVTVRERYNPVLLPANGTVHIHANALGGFLCTVDGTITIEVAAQDGMAAYTLLSGFPVVAGSYTPIPFFTSKNGFTVQSTGAAGVIGTA